MSMHHTTDVSCPCISQSIGMSAPSHVMSSPPEEENYELYEVHPKDLDGVVPTADIILMKKFESAWNKFLQENPHLRARGETVARMAVLQKTLQDTVASQEKAGSELQRQLDFFLESREALEETYASEVQYADSLQQVIRDRLETQLDRVAMSDYLMNQTVPWEFFLDTVDMKAIPYICPSPKGETQGVKPSARAMALIDPDGDAEDVRLRALRMDHALYSTELKMLEKESELIDLTNESHEFVGKFLTENNIWGILNKQQGSQGAQEQQKP